MGRLHEVTNISWGSRTVERLSEHLLTCAGDASPAWHALYTRYQHEKVTARILTDKGFEVFLPLYSASQRYAIFAKLTRESRFSTAPAARWQDP